MIPARPFRGRFGPLLALTLTLALSACSATPTPAPSSGGGGGSDGSAGIPEGCPTSQPAPLAAGETRTVTFSTDAGDIVLAIEADLSPIATGNFVALAECGYYTDTVFHRIVPGFVIQGGDGVYGRQPNLDGQGIGTGGPGYTISDEPITTSYTRGTLAMARSQRPDSQGSQFFIVLDDRAGPGLASANPGYAVMGRVTEGMDVVDTISLGPNAGSDNGNLALEPVTITDVTVTTP
jgi:cyclophilin family peptidyl-prolyl cis-trans isomerase